MSPRPPKRTRAMYHVIRGDELPPSRNRTVQFEGEPYGAGISFFLVDNEPGEGPGLHLHPIRRRRSFAPAVA